MLTWLGSTLSLTVFDKVSDSVVVFSRRGKKRDKRKRVRVKVSRGKMGLQVA